MGYNNEIYMRVREEYRNKAHEKQMEAEARKRKLEAELPALAEVDRALEETALNIWREAAAGTEGLKDRIAKVEKDNLELQEARRLILKTAGYPEDALDVRYDCKKCLDTGVLDNGICDCMKRAIIKESVKSSNISAAIEKQRFDNFSLDYYEGDDRRSMESNLAIIRSALSGLISGSPVFLLFTGDTGLGKTHLSSAIAGEAIAGGCDVVYDSMQNIVRAYEAERFREEDKTIRYAECDLLIIDDLGSEQPSPFAVSCFYNLLNTRLIEEKSILISTNLDAKKLRARYEDRITSRLFGEFIALVFSGRDIRGRRKK